MKSRLKRAEVPLKLLVFFLILAVIFVAAQNILKLKMGHRGTDNVKGYYALENDTVDVLVVGASTAFCTIDPIILYDKWGITSYDFTSSAQCLDLSLLFMREGLKTQKPRIIALELIGLYRELDIDNASDLNYGLTDLKFSPTKAAGVLEMFEEDPGRGLAYLIPMVQYKDRWQELTREDFMPWKDPLTMGAYTPDKISEEPLDFSEYYIEDEEQKVPERNRRIFEKIKELCDQEGIELITFKAPNVGWTIGQTKGAEKYMEKMGVPFIDYFELMDELGIDPAKDFRDNTHLNVTGCRKTSLHFGSYLHENYSLPDERGTKRGERWQLASDNRRASLRDITPYE